MQAVKEITPGIDCQSKNIMQSELSLENQHVRAIRYACRTERSMTQCNDQVWTVNSLAKVAPSLDSNAEIAGG